MSTTEREMAAAVTPQAEEPLVLRSDAGPIRTLTLNRPRQFNALSSAMIAALQAELAQSLRHLSVVRYDAFDDMGGELSWSLALVDDTGSGVVVSSINGRQHSRTYAKSLTDWVCPTQLSPQEQSAIDAVRP